MGQKRSAAGIVRKDGKYVPKPEGFDIPAISIHVNGDTGERKPRRRKLYYRLRVEQQPEHAGKYARNVYLEWSRCPISMPGAVWRTVLFELSLTLEVVADVIRWYKETPGAVIVYEPDNNMRGYLNPKSNGQTSLFE